MADISCDPSVLTEEAKCFKCIPTGMQNEVVIYLLNEILGTGLTAQQLMDNANCFKCIPNGMQPAIQTYLLCELVNAS